jgi:hypothetical protein
MTNDTVHTGKDVTATSALADRTLDPEVEQVSETAKHELPRGSGARLAPRANAASRNGVVPSWIASAPPDVGSSRVQSALD